MLWLVADQKKLSAKARDYLQENTSRLSVSSISAFEIAIKHRRGALKLPFQPMKWFVEVLDFHGIQEIFVDAKVAILSVELPSLHNDPCDRIIVATAMEMKAPVLTPDALIRAYSGVEVVW